MKKGVVIISIVILVIVGLLVWGSTNKKDAHEDLLKASSREVALTCTTDMATEFHIHPEIRIFMDGQEVLVPKNLGIRPTCMTSIHTHEDTPVIHVEAPVQKDFTLGDFFAVWEKDFSSTQLFDKTVSNGAVLVVTVNGKKVDTYENTVLHDKDKIMILYQSPS